MRDSGTAEAGLRTYSPHAAEALLHSPGQDFPAVPAMSLLVELVELAAARVLRGRLAPGHSSVAIAMSVRRCAPSSVAGADWRAIAHPLAVRGRLHDFRVEVFDESGVIACAEHTRAVVVERRLLAIARRRAGGPAMLLMA